MSFFQWLRQSLMNLSSGWSRLCNWFYDAFNNLKEAISTGDWSSLFGQFNSFSDKFWDFIQNFNIFGDFGVSSIYGWVPEPQLVSALSFMFTFGCLLGSLKLLKKIVPFW